MTEGLGSLLEEARLHGLVIIIMIMLTFFQLMMS